jgi:hypothetical protein
MFTFPRDLPLRTCSAEDLLVLKAFADRPNDWLDVDGIVIRQGAAIDWGCVQRHLTPLVALKEEPGILERLHGAGPS